MNILYLSHLRGESYAGPTYSVPNQIAAQSKLDNVFWYNAIHNSIEEWKKLDYYHDLNEYPDESIIRLPKPFNSPDIIVIELFYNMVKSNFLKELINTEIPYVIIPRGELTFKAQKRKALKKTIANILVCKKYARKAAAIQYLTEQEYMDSGNSWNENYFIIPNGINIPNITKTSFTKKGIKCISIGRIEPYQKGIDLLIKACEDIKKELIKAHCQITICGPDKENKVKELRQDVKDRGLSDIISFRDGIYGKEKEKLLLDSDVFLITSRFEGHPMALIEALSYGLPCVVTKGSNMKTEIDKHNAGWTADNDEESIKNALKKMISEKDCFADKGECAVVLSKKYAWDFLADRSHNAFKGIL
ncbi:MAG: glycosyltransferase [Lachnospiraceae bacterium]|nr:glycosyltransferase [Lachnospiraceae bacterium]